MIYPREAEGSMSAGVLGATFDDHGRPVPPDAADEVATILGFLEWQRATVAWKCDGLDAAGLRTTLGPSVMTLGGLLKHLAFVEDHWLSWYLHGKERQPPWDAVDRQTDPDWEWQTAADDTPEHVHVMWQQAVVRSRAMVDIALADGGVDGLAQRKRPNGDALSVRRILVHMIEEYARHNGHADFLREAADGATGQ